MITVYNFARGGVRGLRVGWQCEEMGLTWRARTFDYPPPADYRAKYPVGSVPFLEDDGGVAMAESVAMMVYLAQRYGPTELLPTDPAAMAKVLQIVVASEASIGGMINPLLAAKFIATEADTDNWTNSFCEARATDALSYADSLLGSADFFVGDSLTLADIAIATTLGMWAGALERPTPPGLAAHRERMAARPAYLRAQARLTSG